VDEVWQDPEYEAWEQRVRDAVVPLVERAAVAITLIPGVRADVRFAVELGLAVMLDKPIIALVQPGMKIPGALAAVAAEIVEVDISRDPDGAQRSIADAFARVMHTGDSHISLEDSDE
jgi:nucleoside 2-deoxyribosyltransferase